MNLKTLVTKTGGQSAFARRIGCPRQAIYQVVRDKRPLSSPLAIKIYVATGLMFDATGEPMAPHEAM